MGVVSKRIHQRKTNRLAEPQRAVTRLDADQVLVALNETITSTPPKAGLLQSGQKLWIFGTAPGPWKVYYGPPGRKQPDKVVQVWLAHVDIKPASDGTETLVTVELVQWKTRDGKLVARPEFEHFRDQFAARLVSADPAYRSLEGGA